MSGSFSDLEAGTSTLTYSANGEMTTDEEGNTLSYDGWGRLVRWDDPGTTGTGGQPEKAYVYDALYRRIEESGALSPRIQSYYSAQWQVLEEREVAGSTTVERQYVWSPVYVDALILRDTDGDGDGDLTEHADERHFVQHDANFNITAVAELQNRGLSNETATVVERYIYDPYGTRTVLDADWTADADGLSDVDFTHGHQGGKYDETTGAVHFRFRDLDSVLGRWNRQDPLGYVDGMQQNAYVGDNPVAQSDSHGLQRSRRTWLEQRKERHRAKMLRLTGNADYDPNPGGGTVTVPDNDDFLKCLQNCMERWDVSGTIVEESCALAFHPIPKTAFEYGYGRTIRGTGRFGNSNLLGPINRWCRAKRVTRYPLNPQTAKTIGKFTTRGAVVFSAADALTIAGCSAKCAYRAIR
ncbi:MAG: RHS repeat-associated core domain-containing protein [Planctomycetota bacterium]